MRPVQDLAPFRVVGWENDRSGMDGALRKSGAQTAVVYLPTHKCRALYTYTGAKSARNKDNSEQSPTAFDMTGHKHTYVVN